MQRLREIALNEATKISVTRDAATTLRGPSTTYGDARNTRQFGIVERSVAEPYLQAKSNKTLAALSDETLAIAVSST
ncbi:hypothetical protein L6452_05773 [Arctium lappa]|uniref:Uncharacterized protein n=1 Tax=Arctium lappa TaxID=4217 RepID=A0ACB9EHD4_ARCLA|nr:hypothetical protein L6452_05773 [Arctium lappa]